MVKRRMRLGIKWRSQLPWVALMALIAGVVVAGCGGGSSTAEGAGNTTEGGSKVEGSSFGFAYGFESSPVYETVLKPALAEAKRLGVHLLQGSANGKCEAQLNDIENMIQSGAKAITFLGLCGTGEAYARPMGLAKRNGTVMVSYDFADPEADGSITFDAKQAGELTAANATHWLKTTFKGNYSNFTWAMMPCSQAPPEVAAGMEFERKAIVKLTGVQPFEDVDCALEPQTGQEATEGWLQKAPQLNMVIGLNDAGALGAYQALKQSTTVDRKKLYVAGSDGQREAVQLVANGGDGIYRFTAALPTCQIGHDVVSVPAGILSESGEASSVVMKYVGLSVENQSAARKFYDEQFNDCH